jgi:hypothetical protein
MFDNKEDIEHVFKINRQLSALQKTIITYL